MSTNGASMSGADVRAKGASGAAGAAGGQGATRRLQIDLKKLMGQPVPGVSAFPGNDMLCWAFEGQSYKLQLKFPAEYPYAAPTVEFAKHAMFHPNVHFETGGICLDILKDKWSPMYDVRTILLSIQSLLGEPNNESPLNGKAAALWSNAAEYKAVVVKTAEHSAAHLGA